MGQPDFITPWHIREAAIDSLEKGRTYYTSNSGLMTLRQEISTYLNRRFGLSYNPGDEILVSVGGSEAIDLAIRACINDCLLYTSTAEQGERNAEKGSRRLERRKYIEARFISLC